ncbi:MAG: GNAT family N-acetyltransferase [Alphaproteobacteria bacterium]|nr:GNAT family N-acetyltransferase [Alphaproteobacteria bacterium]
MTDTSSPAFGHIRIPVNFVAGSQSAKTSAVCTARIGDKEMVIDLITGAFQSDPVWSWVFPRKADQRRYWEMFIKGAIRYPHTYHTADYEAVSVWIPPSQSAFLPEDSENFSAIIESMTGPRTEEILTFLQKFDDCHPRERPHYYLGLLAVKDGHRGKGIGIELLKENLARFDSLGVPAYLESSNKSNNRKYEALGFLPVVEFTTYSGGPAVTGMWRDPK